MERRQFLASSLTASAAAFAAPGSLLRAQEASRAQSREYYQLRTYHLGSSQASLINRYFSDALIPALNRLNIRPVGVFSQTIGAVSPAMHVLMPSQSAESLLTVDHDLMQDSEYTKAAADFLNAPDRSPAMAWMDSKLLHAFEKMPRLTVPTSTNTPRVFELRTYESLSIRDHLRKVEMMNSGEADIFAKSGFWQVFYGNTIVGSRQPNLTYMVGFPSLADRDKCWAAFFSSPEWKKLTSNPRFNFEPIVSNVTNLIVTPTRYSQV
jgi:hypothetical protein